MDQSTRARQNGVEFDRVQGPTAGSLPLHGLIGGQREGVVVGDAVGSQDNVELDAHLRRCVIGQRDQRVGDHLATFPCGTDVGEDQKTATLRCTDRLERILGK